MIANEIMFVRLFVEIFVGDLIDEILTIVSVVT